MSAAVQARCQAQTRAGQRCRRAARAGSGYCAQHARSANSHPDVGDRVALRRQLAAEVNGAVDRLRQQDPAFEPPPLDIKAVVELARNNLERFAGPLPMLRDAVADSRPRDWLDPETWRGLGYIVEHSLRYQVEAWQEQLGGRIPDEWVERARQFWREDAFDRATWEGLWFLLTYTARLQVGQARRRRAGDYETDPWGLDEDVVTAIRPLLVFLYKVYFRVDTSGIENVPAEGRALLVANHAGQFPFDAVMVATAVGLEQPEARLVRTLYGAWFPTLPFLAPLLASLGQTLATVENGTRLLEADELVATFPEGYKGSGKLFRHRYKLARFGRGGFVKMALRTGAPLIPVAIVGAEETYISLYKSRTLARLTGFPFFPITPRWPWLGPLGALPLPTKWTIDFGEPIAVDSYGPAAADDQLLVADLTARVRDVVQHMVNQRRRRRPSIFF